MNIVHFHSRFFLFVTILILVASCNGQEKLAKEKKSEPIKYDSGDVVTQGYLDKLGNIWFTTTKEGT